MTMMHEHQDWVDDVTRQKKIEREDTYGTNPVLDAIDAGHGFIEDKQRGLICKMCMTPWPCEPMSTARTAASVRGARMHNDLRAKPVPGKPQYMGS